MYVATTLELATEAVEILVMLRVILAFALLLIAYRVLEFDISNTTVPDGVPVFAVNLSDPLSIKIGELKVAFPVTVKLTKFPVLVILGWAAVIIFPA